MSDPVAVKFIIASATEASFNSFFKVIVPGDWTTFQLTAVILPGSKHVKIDLPELPTGTRFILRLITHTLRVASSPQVLTYSPTSTKAAYFKIADTTSWPTLTFTEYIDSPPTLE